MTTKSNFGPVGEEVTASLCTGGASGREVGPVPYTAAGPVV